MATPPPPATLAAPGTTSSISGFYTIKDANTATFYVTSSIPPELKTGVTLLNLPGIIGNTLVKDVVPYQGVYGGYGAFNGSFDFQADKAQTIQGIVPVAATTIATQTFTNPAPQYTTSGTYFVSNFKVYFYSKIPLPPALAKKWILTGLPGIAPVLEVLQFQTTPGKMGPKRLGDPTPSIQYAASLVLAPVPRTAALPSTPPTGVTVGNQVVLSPRAAASGFRAPAPESSPTTTPHYPPYR